MTRFSIIEVLASLMPFAALPVRGRVIRHRRAERTSGDVRALSGHLQRDLGLTDAELVHHRHAGSPSQQGLGNPSSDRILFPGR
ncbi:MAG: hypothetical protein KDJ19_04770 [Hyphomicrobiaceae bacterium]|nr:hypothetical protein [Hyphomicrobiaceae bacterium]MCC0022665.1 hypothetical protein [Hyphomicrobiaceae bacterium]